MRGQHILILALYCAATAQAQTIYRCGSSYSQTPCSGGSAVEPGTAPSREQAREHAATVRREQKAAEQLAKSRQREEATQARAERQARKSAPDERTMEAYDPARDVAPDARHPKYFTARSAPAPKPDKHKPKEKHAEGSGKPAATTARP